MADLYSVYKDIGGVRTKMTAYKDIDGVRTKISSAESEEVVPNTYNITTSLYGCFGYSTNPTEIDEGESVTLRFTPSSGYALPTSIYVSGAEYEWYWSVGELVLRNPTGAVYVSISAVATGGSDAYDITVNWETSGSAYSTNPTQISEGETVELVFRTDFISSATAVGADCSYTCEQSTDFFVYTILTVTLSNPTGDVTVTIGPNGAPPLLPDPE